MTELDFTEEPEVEAPSDAEIDSLLRQNPPELMFAPPSYARMDRDTEGTWKIARDGSTPVAIVWTDWQEGAGVIPIRSSEVAAELLRYFVANKMMNAPAGIAFTSSSHLAGVTFDETEDGLLIGAMQDAYSLSKES